jgi:hypothetical protein
VPRVECCGRHGREEKTGTDPAGQVSLIHDGMLPEANFAEIGWHAESRLLIQAPGVVGIRRSRSLRATERRAFEQVLEAFNDTAMAYPRIQQFRKMVCH